MTSTLLGTAASTTSHGAIRARGLRKTYGGAGEPVHALAGIDLDIATGEVTAIMGPSGSGKSTLLRCLAGLDTLSAGLITYAGAAVLFADEPTGNLDSRGTARVLSSWRRSVRELGRTIVMVTHDPNAAGYVDRVVLLADGRVAGELTSPSPATVLRALLYLDGGPDLDRDLAA